jgi:hypothetical protein
LVLQVCCKRNNQAWVRLHKNVKLSSDSIIFFFGKENHKSCYENPSYNTHSCNKKG